MSEQPGFTRFVILGGARTGSNMLVSALNTHPDVRCFGELFKFVETSVDFRVEGFNKDSLEDVELRNRDFQAFLNRRIFHPVEGLAAIGFKLHYGHFFGFPGLREWLVHEEDICVLHLRRRNLLRMFVSEQIAKGTGGWVENQRPSMASRVKPSVFLRAVRRPGRYAARLRDLVSPPPPPAWKGKPKLVTVKPQDALESFEKTALLAEYYDKLFAGHRTHTMFYEDLVENWQPTLDEVQRFLGLRPRPLEAQTARQNPEPLRELIANYDELCVALDGTEYEVFLE